MLAFVTRAHDVYGVDTYYTAAVPSDTVRIILYIMLCRSALK